VEQDIADRRPGRAKAGPIRWDRRGKERSFIESGLNPGEIGLSPPITAVTDIPELA